MDVEVICCVWHCSWVTQGQHTGTDDGPCVHQ